MPGLRKSVCSGDRPGCRPASDRELVDCPGCREALSAVRVPAEPREQVARSPKSSEAAAERPPGGFFRRSLSSRANSRNALCSRALSFGSCVRELEGGTEEPWLPRPLRTGRGGARRLIGAVLGTSPAFFRSRQIPNPRKPLNCRSRSNTGKPDISTTICSSESSSGQNRTIPLKVCRAAMAAAIWPFGSRVRLLCNLDPGAIKHGRRLRSERARRKFPTCEAKSTVRIRLPNKAQGQTVPACGQGWRNPTLLEPWYPPLRSVPGIAAGPAKTTSNVKVDPAPSFSTLICPAGDLAFGSSVETRLASEPFCAECQEVAPFAKQLHVPQAAPRSARRRR